MQVIQICSNQTTVIRWLYWWNLYSLSLWFCWWSSSALNLDLPAVTVSEENPANLRHYRSTCTNNTGGTTITLWGCACVTKRHASWRRAGFWAEWECGLRFIMLVVVVKSHWSRLTKNNTREFSRMRSNSGTTPGLHSKKWRNQALPKKTWYRSK